MLREDIWSLLHLVFFHPTILAAARASAQLPHVLYLHTMLHVLVTPAVSCFHFKIPFLVWSVACLRCAITPKYVKTVTEYIQSYLYLQFNVADTPQDTVVCYFWGPSHYGAMTPTSYQVCCHSRSFQMPIVVFWKMKDMYLLIGNYSHRGF